MAIEIPSGLSKEERAKRVAERNEKIAKLRDDASEDKSKVSEQAKAEKEEVRTSASRKKKRVTEDTKEERADNSANAKSVPAYFLLPECHLQESFLRRQKYDLRLY